MTLPGKWNPRRILPKNIDLRLGTILNVVSVTGGTRAPRPVCGHQARRDSSTNHGCIAPGLAGFRPGKDARAIRGCRVHRFSELQTDRDRLARRKITACRNVRTG